jgi:hypothetical protein
MVEINDKTTILMNITTDILSLLAPLYSRITEQLFI